MANQKKKRKTETAEANDTLKEMVSSLNELPTEVLTQLLKNLEDIEAYNKEHPEEIYGKKKK